MKMLSVELVSVLVLSVVVAEDAPLVSTDGGWISGVRQTANKGRALYAYHSIPYAQPPLNHLRLKDPVPGEPWEGIKDGSKMPEPCLQVPFRLITLGHRMLPENINGSEDCLYLNVFTPANKTPKSELPVMVWIHGGAFYSGAAQEYLPFVFLNHDVVLVVIQYRLGVMGFLSTEDSVIPGNFGLKDQTLALQWVQRNIHNFGGDKTKVTVFGESAGGASVHFHMLAPKSKGLFSRVIMQSGSALAPWATGFKFRETAEEVGQAMGCPVTSDSHVLLECLQKVDAPSLAAVLQDFIQWYVFPLIFNPRVDGDFIPDHPAKLVLEGRHHKVDLMAGVTSDDGALVTHALYASRNLISDLKVNFTTTGPASIQMMEVTDGEDVVEVTRRVYHHYLGEELNVDEDHSEALTQLFSDAHFMVDHDLVTQHHAHYAHHHNTYRYEFGYRGEISFGDLYHTHVGKHWVPHADDLIYQFHHNTQQKLSKIPGKLSAPEDLRVTDIMATLWTNFATTGNPTPDGSLGFTWEPSTEDNLQYLALNLKPTMVSDQRQEVRKFFASLPTKINHILYPDRVLQDDTLQHNIYHAQDEL
ncbi:venom carboxylesterase-6 isoform X1 [Cherax quadricarinatus]